MLDKVIFSGFDQWRENKAFLVDTNILSDMAKNGPSKLIGKKLLSEDCVLIYALPSIMELGFGPTEKAELEAQMCDDLYIKSLGVTLHAEELSRAMEANLENFKGKWISVSPDRFNWFAAKKTLVHYMNEPNVTSKKAKTYQIDALLSGTAWNIRSFIWTNDIDDFLKINYYMFKNRYGQSPNYKEQMAKAVTPIFTTQMLEEIINGQTFNVYERMQDYISDRNILEILGIARNISQP